MGKASKAKQERKKRRVVLTQAQAHEFLRVVRDDLEFLRSLDYRKPSRAAVRVASSILRRLLYDGMYMNGWTLAGLAEEPRFTAVDLVAVVSKVEPRFIHYAYAGGATTEGANHTGYGLFVIPKAEAETEGYEAAAKRISALLLPGQRKAFTLQKFCESPAVISGSASVSRLGIIRYVANKLGGVHWDSQRGEWTDPVGSRHRLLDEGHLIVGRLPAPLYEVISIAQVVAISDDTSQFIARVDELAPENKNAVNVIRFREGRTGSYANMTFNSTNQDSKK